MKNTKNKNKKNVNIQNHKFKPRLLRKAYSSLNKNNTLKMQFEQSYSCL